MIKVVLLAALVVCALASPRQPRGVDYVAEQSPSFLSVHLSQSPNGEYTFAYQLNDGRYHAERGTLQNAGTPQEYLRIEGRRRSCNRPPCTDANMQDDGFYIDVDGILHDIMTSVEDVFPILDGLPDGLLA